MNNVEVQFFHNILSDDFYIVVQAPFKTPDRESYENFQVHPDVVDSVGPDVGPGAGDGSKDHTQ